MSFRWSPSSGPRPFRSPRQRPSKSPPSTPEPLARFSRKIKARYIVGADGALIEVGRDPEVVEQRSWCIRCLCEPCKCLPVIRDDDPRFPLIGLLASRDDDDEDFEDTDDYPEEREPELPKEWMAGPITGWRCWFVNESEGLLRSVTQRTAWAPGVPMKGDPAPGNHSGIYAMKARELLRDDYDNDRDFMVFGKVALWGKVIEHAKGYRAQYAYPLEIDLRVDAAPMPGFPSSPMLDAVAAKIRYRYGCVVLTGQRDLMERHITRD